MASLSDLISKNQNALIEAWTRELLGNPTKSPGRITDAELRRQTHSLLQLIASALESNDDVASPAWQPTPGVSRRNLALACSAGVRLGGNRDIHIFAEEAVVRGSA
jgi:hypothetical protein